MFLTKLFLPSLTAKVAKRKTKKTYGERAFSVAAPRLWKKLPLYTRISSSEAVFKANLLA